MIEKVPNKKFYFNNLKKHLNHLYILLDKFKLFQFLTEI